MARNAEKSMFALLSIVIVAMAACDSGNEPPVSAGVTQGDTEATRPNVLVILADDLGYSDISPFGSEIDTPNLLALANEGAKFTRFYASPTCSPTRAMLMTGIDAHLVGLGTMAERRTEEHEGLPGYEGHLNHSAAALPEVFRAAGYHTYMTGKWHLGKSSETNPHARGFERSFALLDGAAFHLTGEGYRQPEITGSEAADYTENGEPANVPEDFYSTRLYVDKLISYIDEHNGDERPFFAYLALTAPHWPLQAPESSRDKYAGRYDEGYDVWYQRRLEGMRSAGVFPDGATEFPRYPGERPWVELAIEERRYSARKMEVQAAMIDDMDHYIGELFEYLQAIGQYENTIILFLSDNGIDARNIDERISSIGDWPEQCCDNSLENVGAADSYVWIGPSWGRLSSGPFRLWKSSTAEGGIRVPAIIRLPGEENVRDFVHETVTVKDVMPTLLHLAGVAAPGEMFQGRRVLPMQGRVVSETLVNEGPSQILTAGWELSGKRSLIHGEWKLLWDSEPFGEDYWTLYNLDDDPGEMNDLSAELPEKLAEMRSLWQDYIEDNNVVEDL